MSGLTPRPQAWHASKPAFPVLTLAAIALAGLLAGCGQRGPLYLPDESGRPGSAASQNTAQDAGGPAVAPDGESAGRSEDEGEDADTLFSSDFNSDDPRP